MSDSGIFATLSIEEQATNFVTMRHIERVRNLLNQVIVELLSRGEQHDQSKLEEPELAYYKEHTRKLCDTEYDSSEYHAQKKLMAPALEHHYANNRHHPQHHKNGIEDMDLIDVIEMFVDWKASSERQMNGNILKSIEKNTEYFKLSPQLAKIFENTAKHFDR